MLQSSENLAGLRVGENEEVVPAAITDVGCEREINEDRYAVLDSHLGKVWLVCDGMGGCLGGELAAQLAIDAIRRSLDSHVHEDPAQALLTAVQEANRVIVLRRQNPAFSSMGTTIIAAMISGDKIVLAHAGDSRAYLVRGENIQQLTVDHTYVQDLVERGQITEEEALSHPQAHVLTRCLGSEPRLTVDCQSFWSWKVEEGEPVDTLVLCSDGLYSLVSEDEVAGQIAVKTPHQACTDLVDLAKNRGGYDNITVAILPLPGNLKEEEPPASRRLSLKISRTAKRAVTRESVLDSLSLGKKLILLMFLFLIGALLTTISVILSLAG